MRLVVLFAFFAILPAPFSTATASDGFALTGVTIIDTNDGSTSPGMTVRVRDGRIERIATDMKLPDGVEVIDAKGKFLIPGLWDMHIHWYTESYLPLFVANGVTGVRQMFGGALHQDWKERMKDGELLGPRHVVASRIVDGPEPVWPGSIAVGDPEEGRKAVNTAIKEGADFVKVYSLLSRDAYFAIADEAGKREIPFAGHVPRSVSAAEASDAGQRSIEHLTGVLTACSSEEQEIREEIAKADGWQNQTERLLRTYNEGKAASLFARFAENGTWHCPTLTILHNVAFMPDPAIVDDSNLKYMPPFVRSMWDPDRVPRWMSPEAFAKSLEIVGDMHDAGVGILAGTDVLNPYCFPGFSLHGELELLVRAGLTPLEALQAATLNPAEYLDIRDRFGTVEEGHVADLVLLEANPLESIGNTRRIAAVVLDGRLYRKADLERMLAEVEKLANP